MQQVQLYAHGVLLELGPIMVKPFVMHAMLDNSAMLEPLVLNVLQVNIQLPLAPLIALSVHQVILVQLALIHLANAIL